MLGGLLLVIGACTRQDGPAAAPTAGIESADLSFESYVWHAVLRDDTGTVHALRERFDRLSPRHPAVIEAGGGTSAWRYNAVMRVEGAIVHGARPALAWLSVQRAAAGLADLPPTRRFGVLAHRVNRDAAIDAPAHCAAHWQLELGGHGRLDIAQARCPTVERSADLTRSVSDALPATLEWVEDGAVRSARGVAWLEHANGPVPAPGGAVIFDTAVLTLREVGTLALTRSRRRSGRGTPVVSGTVSHRGMQTALIEPRWSELPSQPGRSRLEVDSLGVDVVLDTLVLPAANGSASMPLEVSGIAASSEVWFASGTHRGTGLVRFADADVES